MLCMVQHLGGLEKIIEMNNATQNFSKTRLQRTVLSNLCHFLMTPSPIDLLHSMVVEGMM